MANLVVVLRHLEPLPHRNTLVQDLVRFMVETAAHQTRGKIKSNMCDAPRVTRHWHRLQELQYSGVLVERT